MKFSSIPADLQSRIRSSIASYGRAGISLSLIDTDSEQSALVYARQESAPTGRYLSASELQERAFEAFRGAADNLEVKAFPLAKFHVHKIDDRLAISRLTNPEFTAFICAGVGDHQFELDKGGIFYLECDTDVPASRLSSAAYKAKSIIIQRNLFKDLPK